MQAENIKTLSFGCRLNALEAEKIKNMLGHAIKTAIVVNTCAVTAEAERQSGQAIRRLGRENPNSPIFVTGCAATRNPGLFADIPNVIVIPNADKMRIDAYMDALAAGACHISNPHIDIFHHNAPNMSKQFVQVQNGCNHKCAYCVTRLLRGPAVSFAYDDILNDVRTAVAGGFGEIILTGVDIASYARDGMAISDVCERILNDVPGVKRLRLSSMDPASPQIFKILELMRRDERMMRHMHLSMQSGSDTILNAMHRRHNADTVRKIVAAAPDVTFSWDIICGFAGETDELFAETMDLVRDVRPIKIHAFPFSPRPGTEGATLPNQVPRDISRRRVKIITDAANEIRREFMASQIGKTVSVLVEENNIARDQHDLDIKITGDKIPARTICDVKLTGIDGDALVGEMV